MAVQNRSIEYEDEGVALEGQLAWDDAVHEPRPGVLVVHDAMKNGAGFELDRARVLASMGYVGFAIDVYGKGVFGSESDDAYQLMEPFQADRAMLGRRLMASVRAARMLPEIEATRLAAIGYCFGGMCVLDLARMNAPLRGVASFHGLLTGPPEESTASAQAPVEPNVLVLHGWDDPFVPSEQIEPFAEEMSRRGADWQLLAFGDTKHSFTNPEVDLPEMGAVYQPRSEARAWRALVGFLEEIFE